MKTKHALTLILVVLFLFGHVTKQLAATPISEHTDPNDTTEVESVRFDLTYNAAQKELRIVVSGVFDLYSSVSVAGQRGSEILFSFVDSGTSEIVFDLTDLKTGPYYIILNTGEEIRMKRFMKE
jgi:hypothetical protein